MSIFEIHFEIPVESAPKELLEMMGFSEKEIEIFSLKKQKPEDIERNKRMMKSGEIEFNEYEEVK